jgi:signal transduction histidine kinase
VTIKTFSQLLPERLTDKDFQLRFANLAQREVDAIGRIIERLLNYAGPTELARVPISLEAVAHEVIERLAPDLQAQQIAVETNFARSAPPLPADHDQITQVLRNVMINAVQAMPSGGVLRISTAVDAADEGPEPATYRMVIADTGCGIPKEKLANVFNPFFTTKERGFGLGLSRARNVMEEHGGSIEIDSEPGRGTTVTLVFPLAHSVENSHPSTLQA